MDIDVLKNCGTVKTFEQGQILCQEGEIGHSMYILLMGEVEISINSFSDNPQSLGSMPEGSFFGEMSLLEDKPRSATIIACSPEVIVLEVNELDFSKLLLNATSITYRLLLTLNSRLNNMLARIEQTDKNMYSNTRETLSIQLFRSLTSAPLTQLPGRILTMSGHF